MANDTEINNSVWQTMLASFAKALVLRLRLHDAIYRPDSFMLMLRYYANLKAIRYESASLNRIVADKSHHVILRSLYDYVETRPKVIK